MGVIIQFIPAIVISWGCILYCLLDSRRRELFLEGLCFKDMKRGERPTGLIYWSVVLLALMPLVWIWR